MSARLVSRNLSPDQIIGERVHRIMWRQRLSQVQLARSLGVSQGALSRKLRGERPWFAAEVLDAAGALGVSLCELYGELIPEAGTPIEARAPRACTRPLVMSASGAGAECSR